ncbi:hypothetical protein LAZ67_20000966 [Cordylochernes scorpioides]|uniref:Uncharacterized protein n=1 Tax=Cordylochernes scorpioides TaxID=51811 RepID=A0ABY6LJH3_9ARAC|nr:hypothetical protein LAZ67_20000966 [Cordylochernes scorpioides]
MFEDKDFTYFLILPLQPDVTQETVKKYASLMQVFFTRKITIRTSWNVIMKKPNQVDLEEFYKRYQNKDKYSEFINMLCR